MRRASSRASGCTGTCRPRATWWCGRVGPTPVASATPASTGPALPSPYNVYALTSGDPAYEPDREDLLILYRPLFFTSFMLADFLADNGYFGAEAVVLSSASSKTSYGTAFLLRGEGPRVVGLTSPGNVEFTRGLGCYDDVVTYDRVGALDPARPTAYLDVAGDARIRTALREHLGDRLVHDAAVGVTHQEPTAMSAGHGVLRAGRRCASGASTGDATAWTPGSVPPGAGSRRSPRAGWTWSSATDRRR